MVATRRDHGEMLQTAGFGEVMETDVTAEYLRTARDWFEARERYAPQLRRSPGEVEFEQRQADSKAQVAAIEEGLLRRSLFVAKRP